MLVVDPWHWLEEDGSVSRTNRRLRRNVTRVAQLIEYGGPLLPGQVRDTLLECRKRPDGRACSGFLRVAKQMDDSLLAFCEECGTKQVSIHNWQGTRWASGPPAPSVPR